MISDDYGRIPKLRDPYKPDKKIQRFQDRISGKKRGMRKYANSIVANRAAFDRIRMPGGGDGFEGDEY